MMRSTSIGEYSSGDDSSDIRTIRTNATHMFSQGSTSYYTNPTLAPPTTTSHRHMIINPHREDDDDEDQTTLTDDVSATNDFTSPTSIMTNYESYSKFGAAPIYQNVLSVVPTTKVPKQPQPSSQLMLNQEDRAVFSLNTIAEENHTTSGGTATAAAAAVASPTKVYHPPSFYKNQRRTTAPSSTPVPSSSVTTNTSGKNKSGSNHNTVTAAAAAKAENIHTSQRYGNDDRSTDYFTTSGGDTNGSHSAASRTTTKSIVTTSTAMSRTSQPSVLLPNRSTNTTTGNTTQQGVELKMEHRTTSSSSSSAPTSATSSTAFSIFKRMTAVSGNSPLRNRSQSSSPVPPTMTTSSTTNHPKISKESSSAPASVPVVPSSSTMSTGSNNSCSSGNSSVHSSNDITTGTTSVPPPPPPTTQPTRSLRNYMHTLAYKSRRNSNNNSPITVTSGRVTPPPVRPQSKKEDASDHIPISPTTSIHSTTSHSSHYDSTKSSIPNASPPPTQELIATPIKSNSSSSNGNHIKKRDLPFVDAVVNKERRTLNDFDDIRTKTKPSVLASPTTASTITTTSSSGSSSKISDASSHSTPYYNPVLKSVSSKLFSPSEESPSTIHTAAAAVPPPHNDHPYMNDTRNHSKTDVDAVVPIKARLNLKLIDHLAAIGDDTDIAQYQDIPPKESFRLWTDEDSAFGTSWYSFSTSPFVGEQDDTVDTSMESYHSATGGAGAVAALAATATSESNVSVSNLPTDPNLGTAKTLITPSPLTNNILPTVEAPSRKLSLSLLQLKHYNRTTSIGSTDDDDDTTHRYPSMVSSEYEDEGGTLDGGTSTLDGTINYPTDDCTTLGGGPSFDFSVSACVDDESLTNPKEKESTNIAAAAEMVPRSNPIVYSNVGQAFSRGDMIATQSMSHSNHTIPKAGSRLVPPLLGGLDRPVRRRSSSAGMRSLSSPPQSTLEVIDEHLSHDHKLSHESASSEPSSSGGPSAMDTMVVVSLADGSVASSKIQSSSQGNRSTTEGHKEEIIRVVRRLDSVQIGIIILIAVALSAIICATFCVIGSCHVGKNNGNANNRILTESPMVLGKSPATSKQYLRKDLNLEAIPKLVHSP